MSKPEQRPLPKVLSPSRFAGIVLLCVLVAAAGCSNFASQGINAEGVRLYDQARYTEATQQFQRAVETDPTAADGYYNLAATYHRLALQSRRPADLAQAERYYYLCLDRDADHRECYRGLAVLLCQQDRSAEAFRLLQSWSDRSPTSPEPRIELARLSEEFGDRQAATQYLADALDVDPNNERTLRALGWLREQSGEQAQALANYQQSLSANRFQPDVATRVAALQSTVGPAPFAGGAAQGTRMVTRGAGTPQ